MGEILLQKHLQQMEGKRPGPVRFAQPTPTFNTAQTTFI